MCHCTSLFPLCFLIYKMKGFLIQGFFQLAQTMAIIFAIMSSLPKSLFCPLHVLPYLLVFISFCWIQPVLPLNALPLTFLSPQANHNKIDRVEKHLLVIIDHILFIINMSMLILSLNLKTPWEQRIYLLLFISVIYVKAPDGCRK